MFEWLMGNTKPKSNKISFEDIQWILDRDDSKYLLISTLSKNDQKCLIQKTIPIEKEVEVINSFLKNKEINIIIYGRNTNDTSIYNKYNQLTQLGFSNVYIYLGGLFEWLCLQDIYGMTNFPTTKKELDILKFKGKSVFANYLLEDID